MSHATGIVQDGVIVPTEPLSWPNGTRVEIALQTATKQGQLGETMEDDSATSAESIAKWLEELRAIPTPVWTLEEELSWEARRREDKAWELAHAEEREAKLRASWE